MDLIVGLGNPGSNYEHTRHNTGFLFVDELAKKDSCEWQQSHKLFSLVAKPAAQDILYAKPQTFMNDSGQAVHALLSYYNIPLTNLTVVHDDLDIKLGEYQLSAKSPKTHNGILSIEKHLGSTDFKHIRIGIDNRDLELPISGEQYVLGRFLPEENLIINKVIHDIMDSLDGSKKALNLNQ